MIPVSLIKSFALDWFKKFSLKKLKAFADDPRPDFKTELPKLPFGLGGGWIYIYLAYLSAPAPSAKAKRLAPLSSGGTEFQVWWEKR